MATTLAVRPPRDADAAALADLSEQLGYPVEVEEIRQRMAAVAANDHAIVLAATDAADRPIGWVHVELKRTLSAPLTAQVVGLVVDEAVRSAGIGKELLAAAEADLTRNSPGSGCVEAIVLYFRAVRPRSSAWRYSIH
jgi:ribosomal protein S18 acetylase RimI-like enzyme